MTKNEKDVEITPPDRTDEVGPIDRPEIETVTDTPHPDKNTPNNRR